MSRERTPVHLRRGIRISAETRRFYKQRDKSLDNDPDARPLPPEKWAHAMRREEFFRVDGRELRKFFGKFNAQYFDGRLPAYSIRIKSRITWLGQYGRCNKKRKLIEIRRGLSNQDSISTLLHEMAHAATTDSHGMSWKKEMIRLREAGAPFASADLTVALDDWDGKRVTRTRFHQVIQDLLMEKTEIGLSGRHQVVHME